MDANASTRTRRRTSRTGPTSSSRSGRASTRETRCSTSPAGTAASGSSSSSAGCATGASTSRRRWSRRPGAGSAVGPRSTPGDLNDYVPPEPVAATTVFRAIYYARDRAAFFRHAAEYTRKKLVFDLNPRQYRIDEVLADLRAAGLCAQSTSARSSSRRPSRCPAPVAALAKALERTGPPARLALRFRFTYLVAASRG